MNEKLGLNFDQGLINSQSENLFNFLNSKFTPQKEEVSENDVRKNLVPVFIDYKAVKDFGLAWHKSINETKNRNGEKTKTSGQPENSITEEEYLTKWSKEIFLGDERQKMAVRQSQKVPIQIDLMPENIEKTDAACVVIDPNNTTIIHTQLSMSPIDSDSSIIFLSNNGISITIKDQTSILGDTNVSNLFKIDYTDNIIIESEDLDELYEIIFREIINRIPSAVKDASNESDAAQVADMPIAMHIPILLLSEKPEENQKRKDEILNSFAKATKNLTRAHPHLRIKVQIPREISLEDVYASYNRM